jgi:copper(I)-binding protein
MKSAVILSLAMFSASALAHQHGHHVNPVDLPVSKTVTAQSCWIRAIPAPAPSGGFFVLSNAGATDVRLKAAQSPSYDMVMLHQTTHSDGMSRMSEVEEVLVPAKGSLEFKPGSYHVMLEKAGASVKVGSVIQLNLALDDGTKVVADCEVKPPNTLSGGMGHGGHGHGKAH